MLEERNMVKLALEVFTTDQDFPFHIQYGSHAEDGCYMHGHEDFSEFVIVLDGDAEHLVGDERYPIAKGDVFVINKYTFHGYIGANNFRICNIMFKPEVIFDGIYNIRQTAGFQALFVLEPHYNQNHRFRSRLRLNSHDFIVIRKLVEDIMGEYSRRDEGWQSLVFSQFIELIVRLSRLYRSSGSGDDEAIFKLASAIARIEKNFSTNISIAELADISGYSERQFTRLFRSAFSMTPGRYITLLRLQKAQQLILSTDLPIGDIAMSCGYEDQNYFSRMFKRATGFAPSEYRRKR